MTRRVFYSFHYQKDSWRVHQIRNIGKIEGDIKALPNQWEEIKRSGDRAIKNWIDHNLVGCSCLVVLIGEETANRKYVLYEIERAWNKGIGVLGIHIDQLKDRYGYTSRKGDNPFKKFGCDPLCFIPMDIPIYNPIENALGILVDFKNGNRYSAYNVISNNIESWIEEAIQYRKGKGNIKCNEFDFS